MTHATNNFSTAPELASHHVLAPHQHVLIAMAPGSELRCLHGRLVLKSPSPEFPTHACPDTLGTFQAWRAPSSLWLGVQSHSESARFVITPTQQFQAEHEKNRPGVKPLRRFALLLKNSVRLWRRAT
jgi:hypothetical protein